MTQWMGATPLSLRISRLPEACIKSTIISCIALIVFQCFANTERDVKYIQGDGELLNDALDVPTNRFSMEIISVIVCRLHRLRLMKEKKKMVYY